MRIRLRTPELVYSIWLGLLFLSFTRLSIGSPRIVIWLSSILMVWRAAVSYRYIKAAMVSPITLPLFLYTLWKIFEVIRSPYEFRAIAISFGDFLCVVFVAVFFVPKNFNVISHTRFIQFFCAAYGMLAIILHPIIPKSDSSSVSVWGFDKGESWLFVHPNVAAMFWLSVFISSLYLLSFPQKNNSRLINISLCLTALFFIIQTNSRTSFLIAMVSISFYLFGNIWSKLSTSSRPYVKLLTLPLAFGLFFALVLGAYIVFLSTSVSQLDELSSGRVLFWLYLVSTVPNTYIGVGLLPPGQNLIYDIKDFGAGIDGLYADIIYTEGYIGLTLFVIVMYRLLAVMSKTKHRQFSYALILPISALLYGLTETHFWLQASPLTILILGSATAVAIKLNSRN